MGKETETKEIENNALENIKLMDVIVENPVYKIKFRRAKKYKKSRNFSPSLLLFVLTVSLISISIIFNAFFLKRLDPFIFKSLSVLSQKYGFYNPQTYIVDQITKPYVVTVGEYGNFAIAKEEAIKLLPTFKQIDIKQLTSGIYTFQIEKCGSREKAYDEASHLTRNGFEAVHVRYLPKQ